jgi:hypothetical protein
MLACLPAPPAETGLAVLHHLPLLHDLSLRGCQQLSDSCLAHLGGLSRLRRLDMRACEHLRGEFRPCSQTSQSACHLGSAQSRC